MKHTFRKFTPLLAMAIALGFSGITLAQDPSPATREQQNDNTTLKPRESTQTSQSKALGGPQGQAPTDSKSLSRSPLTDGQVLQVLRALSNAEIDQADLALDISESEEVKGVAEMIKTDHERANEDIDAVNDVSINMEDSPLSENIEQQAETTHEQLAALEGAAFDCAYLNKQVEGHQMAIETANSQLKANAKNAKVSSLVTSMGPKLEAHLKMAREAQGNASCQ